MKINTKHAILRTTLLTAFSFAAGMLTQHHRMMDGLANNKFTIVVSGDCSKLAILFLESYVGRDLYKKPPPGCQVSFSR